MSGRRCVPCLVVLLGAAGLLPLAGKARGAESDRLIKVTIECDEEFLVSPLQCLGVDVVNASGRGKNPGASTKKMAVECLPNAVLWVCVKDPENKNKLKPESVVRVLPEDDGKTARLRFGDYVCFKNDVPCTVEFVKEQTAAQRDQLLGFVKLAVDGKKADGLTVALPGDESSLPIVEQLKGSGVGIVLNVATDDKKKTVTASKKVLRGVVEAKPRLLTVDCETLALFDGPLSAVESLVLDIPESSKGVVPDLSVLTQLRHLLLVAGKQAKAIDLTPLAKLIHLKALTVFVDRCASVEAIGSMTELEFLTLWCKSPQKTLSYDKLSKLRYLAVAFPVDADFSFIEKTPDMQTLCILDFDAKHNLKPLEKATRLRCLALTTDDEEGKKKKVDFRGFANVKEFQKARPDVEVVEYQGICLGSLWILVLAALAAVAAWAVRRYRRGNRLACQR
jgi:hypothetical protein